MSRFLIISATNVAREPRVIRQYYSLVKDGHEVIVAGFGSEDAKSVYGVNFIPLNRIRIPINELFENLSHKIEVTDKVFNFVRLFRELRKRLTEKVVLNIGVLYFYLSSNLKVRLLNRIILRLCFNYSSLRAKDLTKTLHEGLLRSHIYDLNFIISHDYQTSHSGASISRSFGGTHVIDFHEHPISQYAGTWSWKYKRKLIYALVQSATSSAQKFIFVSEGIRKLMQTEFELPKEATFVIRSLSNYEKHDLNKVESNLIKIVYLGNIVPNRGLEVAIEVISLLPQKYVLHLQGYGNSKYVSALKALAKSKQCDQQVHFIDPVPFEDIVNSLSKYDLGYFVCENFGPQREYALPNKIFQYIMAGLCIVTSKFEAIEEVIREYNCGLMVDDVNAKNIAEAILNLDIEQINQFKLAAISAGKNLCWEREEGKLLEIFEA